MPHIYSFCQIFQELCIFPALRLFQSLDYLSKRISRQKNLPTQKIRAKFLTKKLVIKLHCTVSIFTSNIGSQENWGFDHCSSGVSGKGIKVINVGSNAGQDSSCSNQGVESSNQLWQVSDFNLFGNGRSWKIKSLDKFRQVWTVSYYNIEASQWFQPSWQ